MLLVKDRVYLGKRSLHLHRQKRRFVFEAIKRGVEKTTRNIFWNHVGARLRVKTAEDDELQERGDGAGAAKMAPETQPGEAQSQSYQGGCKKNKIRGVKPHAQPGQGNGQEHHANTSDLECLPPKR